MHSGAPVVYTTFPVRLVSAWFGTEVVLRRETEVTPPSFFLTLKVLVLI